MESERKEKKMQCEVLVREFTFLFSELPLKRDKRISVRTMLCSNFKSGVDC